MSLLAISDLHLGYAENRKEFSKWAEDLSEKLMESGKAPEDTLILAGDLCENLSDFQYVWETLSGKFKQLIWTPGNHELWSIGSESSTLRGEAKYKALVDLCREYKVITPEDDYQTFVSEESPYLLAPLFLLYDYSFRPDSVREEDALSWALEEDLICADEHLLHSDPYPTKSEWCRVRCELTEKRLDSARQLHPGTSFILINHYPLRQDLVKIPAIPRFSIWCGTKRTENWHKVFPVSIVICGHLHYRFTEWRDGVRIEEVSLGYPRQWKRHHRDFSDFIKVILP